MTNENKTKTETKTEVSAEQLGELMVKRSVVNLYYKSKQTGDYWAYQLPNMNVVKLPSDLRGYFPLEVNGFEGLELYVAA